jgi:hypothetical protein
MSDRTRAARVEDVHRLALAMPHVTVIGGTKDNPVYQVGGKSFVFFRNPRPDAVDPDSGERYRDVIVFWVADEAEKQALVQDESTPFFSTPTSPGIRRCSCGPAAWVSCPWRSCRKSSRTRGSRGRRGTVPSSG